MTTKRRVIDSHHHFWQYSAEEYGWIDDSMEQLRRDFLPADLELEIRDAGVDGVISVQARQTVEETRQLCRYAEQNDFIKGVVGWVPLADSNLGAVLEELAQHSALKGVRHVVQDEPEGFLTDKAFNTGTGQLAKYGLTYDLLIFERQLPEAIQFVDRHPEQSFVLDHLGKPKISANELEPWRTNLNELAKREHVACKISGMATEADHLHWTPQQLQPYLEITLEAFGAERLMFGSDWPVSLLACGYGRWLQIVREFAQQLSEVQTDQLFYETAERCYKLNRT